MMKIAAGIGAVDDYEKYVKAGADEIYFGYVPGEYYRKNLNTGPMNRREVMYCNVQAGAESELLILKNMMADLKAPVSVTLNSPGYKKEQYPYIEKYVNKLIDMGFNSFIAADHDLFFNLLKIYGTELSLSGEYGEMNHLETEHLKKAANGNKGKFKRLIFPRQTMITEMKKIREHSYPYPEEYEAFVLNEKCHFTGAYCSSLHCDELCHICHLPYRIEKKADMDADEDPELIKAAGMKEEENECTGSSGCALCSLWKLRDAGITHLKVVSRGNDTESVINDIKTLRQALNILEDSKTEDIFIETMKKELFPYGCSNNCYYF